MYVSIADSVCQYLIPYSVCHLSDSVCHYLILCNVCHCPIIYEVWHYLIPYAGHHCASFEPVPEEILLTL